MEHLDERGRPVGLVAVQLITGRLSPGADRRAQPSKHKNLDSSEHAHRRGQRGRPKRPGGGRLDYEVIPS